MYSAITARAPLRLGLAGGGTDLSPFCDLHGGAVLNLTVDRFAYAYLDLTGGDEIVLEAVDMGRVERHAAAPVLPLDEPGLVLHRAMYNRIVRDYLGGRPRGLRLVTSIDAPPGSGLGSSSALCVAIVQAFTQALDLPLGQYDIAHLAFEVERIDAGLAGGKQDHYAAAFGGINFIEFLEGGRVVVNPLRVLNRIARNVESALAICFTGQSRSSAEIIRQQIDSVTAIDPARLENFHRLKADAHEMKQALVAGDVARMSVILDRSWQSKKATADSVSTDLIDRLYGVAKSAGALAGKVSGAGGGGFMMFLCNPVSRFRVIEALNEAGGVASPVYFSGNGAEAWTRSAPA